MQSTAKAFGNYATMNFCFASSQRRLTRENWDSGTRKRVHKNTCLSGNWNVLFFQNGQSKEELFTLVVQKLLKMDVRPKHMFITEFRSSQFTFHKEMKC